MSVDGRARYELSPADGLPRRVQSSGQVALQLTLRDPNGVDSRRVDLGEQAWLFRWRAEIQPGLVRPRRAEPPKYELSWTKPMPDISDVEWITSIDTSADGRIYAAATTRFDEDGFDTLLVAFDAAGERIWGRILPEQSAYSSAQVFATQDGGATVVVTQVVDGDETVRRARVVPMDRDGRPGTPKTIAGNAMETVKVAARLPGGGFAVAGSQAAPSGDHKAGWLSGADRAWTGEWSGLFDPGHENVFVGVAPGPNGGIVISGKTGDADDATISWMGLLDLAQQERWSRVFSEFDWVRNSGLAALDDDLFVFTANVRFGQMLGAWIAAVDGDGTTQWDRLFLDSPVRWVDAVAASARGTVLVAGVLPQWKEQARRLVWVAELDRHGNLLWDGQYDLGNATLATRSTSCLRRPAIRAFCSESLVSSEMSPGQLTGRLQCRASSRQLR